ncbi:MAG: hypothetical protein AAB592_00670, partial [Patescibacteria group bacterium]
LAVGLTDLAVGLTDLAVGLTDLAVGRLVTGRLLPAPVLCNVHSLGVPLRLIVLWQRQVLKT